MGNRAEILLQAALAARRMQARFGGVYCFYVELSEQGWVASMVDELGNPILPGEDFGAAQGRSAECASEAIVDCLRHYPFTCHPDEGPNVWSRWYLHKGGRGE